MPTTKFKLRSRSFSLSSALHNFLLRSTSFRLVSSYLAIKTRQQNNPYLLFLRKEVIQPHLPIRLPCYDFTPVIGPAFGSSLLIGWVTDFGRY